MYYGAMYGGSTTSILLNVPGEASSVLTCLDGYAMARAGRAGAALGIAAIGSFIAGTFSVVMLNLIAEPLANFAVSFGPPEYFALTFLGLTLVTSLTGKSLVKGIMSAVFGLLIATIGIDVISGAGRFTFGQIELMDGIGLIGLIVGLFAISEVLENIEDPLKQVFITTKMRFRDMFPTRDEWRRVLPVIGRSSIIGFFVGVLPGAGATISSFIAYATEKRLSKHPELYGTGIIEGVAAPETANNGSTGGAMVTLLTLGIPGGGSTAVMLGALLLHGLRPGPLLFHNQPDFVWGFIASMYIGNIMLIILNMPLIQMWVALLRVPYNILMPGIVSLSAIGVLATDNSITDVWIMVGAGILGYLMRKVGFPLAPLVLGYILGPMVENSLRQSLVISHGDLLVFFTRPISTVLITLGLLSLFTPIIRGVWKKAGSPEAEY
ncbi:MAG: tripartite tricarboxylate transporter permease [Chloroflexi bacterium]|nr:MAG: tripartite tricarboxylate transporter permease [Chloroflexota bacterium]